MLKRDELSNPNSCMSRANDDEMVFVLLARDKAAPVAIRAWIAERLRLRLNSVDDWQIQGANMNANVMEGSEPSRYVPTAPPDEALREALRWALSNLKVAASARYGTMPGPRYRCDFCISEMAKSPERIEHKPDCKYMKAADALSTNRGRT